MLGFNNNILSKIDTEETYRNGLNVDKSFSLNNLFKNNKDFILYEGNETYGECRESLNFIYTIPRFIT